MATRLRMLSAISSGFLLAILLCVPNGYGVERPTFDGLDGCGNSDTSPVLKANIIVQLDEHGVELPNSKVGPIEEVGPKVGLSAAQIRQVRKTEGDVWCVNRFNQPIKRGSAQLLLPTIVVTAAHFGLEHGSLISHHPDPTLTAVACFFRNKAGDQRVSVKFDENYAKFYTRNTDKEPGKDLLLLKLDRSIPGAKPFSVDPDQRDLLVGKSEKVLSVTAHMQGRLEHPEQNILQQCHIWAHGEQDKKSFKFEVLDCTALPESSGGSVLSFIDGRIYLYAIIIRSGFEMRNGQSFSITKGSYTTAIKVNQQILTDAISLSRYKDLPAPRAKRLDPGN